MLKENVVFLLKKSFKIIVSSMFRYFIWHYFCSKSTSPYCWKRKSPPIFKITYPLGKIPLLETTTLPRSRFPPKSLEVKGPRYVNIVDT